MNVRASRVAVDLASRARDVTTLLRDELSRATAFADPPAKTDAGEGYLVYYEGPLADATATMLGTSPTIENENTFQDAKFGDYDDILAFTAVAKGENWFRGKVPRFVLDAKTAEINGVAYSAADFPGGVAGALDPVVITSKYAEIIYFVAPEYETSPDDDDASTRILNYDANGSPQFVDFDGNLIPDRLNLHRRVLLIRPDLNLTAPTITLPHLPTPAPIQLASYVTGINEYMIPDQWPIDTTAASAEFPVIKTGTTNGISVEQTGDAWLVGMSQIHQQCDLSVRRINNLGGRPLPNSVDTFEGRRRELASRLVVARKPICSCSCSGKQRLESRNRVAQVGRAVQLYIDAGVGVGGHSSAPRQRCDGLKCESGSCGPALVGRDGFGDHAGISQRFSASRVHSRHGLYSYGYCW